MGRALGADLPKQVTVVGITTTRAYSFGEELSLPVAGALSNAAQIVIDLL
jgi:hypothetical protein